MGKLVRSAAALLASSALSLALVLCVGSCAGAKQESASAASERGEPLTYTLPGLEGGAVDSSSHRGRPTVLLFITTFDVFSQAQASRLEDLYRSHTPRINAVAVVIEAPRNASLVQSFAETLHLTYDVAVAEKRVIEEQGMMSAARSVPAWVFLDSTGRVAAVGTGSLTLQQLDDALKLAETLGE